MKKHVLSAVLVLSVLAVPAWAQSRENMANHMANRRQPHAVVGNFAASPGDIYACDQYGELWFLDPGGGATDIGSTGVQLTDIAFDRYGNLYGIDFGTLYYIDPDSAQAIPIGPLGTISGYANALTFGPDGTLYTADYVDFNLYTVDPTSGQATVVGPIGYSSAGDLAFGPDGTLYLSTIDDTLITVDPTTGQGTLIGPIFFHDVFGLDFLGDTLYGLDDQGEWLTIDPSTGQGTFVALTDPQVVGYGLSVVPNPPDGSSNSAAPKSAH